MAETLGLKEVVFYRNGTHETPIPRAVHDAGGAILEVRFLDGRTVQLAVRNDGGITLRGWGNTPSSVRNLDRLHLSTRLEYEPGETP